MKHIIYGGDGFVGSYLANKLMQDGEKVVVGDIKRSDHAHYSSQTNAVEFVNLDVTKPEDFDKIEINPEDAIYNLSAMMLSPIVTRAERYDFFWPVNYFGTLNILNAMEKAEAKNLVHFTTDMIYGHIVTNPMTEEHPVAPIGEIVQKLMRTKVRLTALHPPLKPPEFLQSIKHPIKTGLFQCLICKPNLMLRKTPAP